MRTPSSRLNRRISVNADKSGATTDLGKARRARDVFVQELQHAFDALIQSMRCDVDSAESLQQTLSGDERSRAGRLPAEQAVRRHDLGHRALRVERDDRFARQ